MNSAFDDFSRSFDSISVDKTKVAALPETPLAFGEATDQFNDVSGPGFTLLDDAGGRFVIDRETGVISLLHDELLETDAGLVFPVKFRCVEFSGLSYEMELKLKISGRVPQIVTQAQAGLFDDVEQPETAPEAEPVVTTAFAPPAAEAQPVIEPVNEVTPEALAALEAVIEAVAPQQVIEPVLEAAPQPKRKIMVAAWDGFAAFRGHAARRPLKKQGPFGALISSSLPPVNVEAGHLNLDEPLPAPAPVNLSWALT